jgi:quercetin dioxygenase-like cupin family protein
MHSHGRLPPESEIIAGFQAWIDLHHGGHKLGRIWGDYSKRCARSQTQPAIPKDRFVRILSGENNLKYQDLSTVLDVLEIPCVDLFFDFCAYPSLSNVVHFEKADCWVDEPVLGNGAGGCRLRYVKKETLGKNRIRLDLLKLEPKGKSRWAPHNGQEFIYLLKGQEVIVVLSENEDLKEAKKFTLRLGEGISFPSGLWHRIENHSARGAELGIARPSRSKPVFDQGTRPPRTEKADSP